MNLNLVDALAVLLIVVAVLFGWRSGFVVQAFALGGFVIGLGLVVFAAPFIAGFVTNATFLVRTAIVVVAVGAIVLICQGIGSVIGGRARQRIGRGVLAGLDSGGGAAFGFVRGLFMVWLLGGLLGIVQIGGLSVAARQSTILRALDSRFPSPVVLAAQLGQLVESAGLPDIFVGAPPPASSLPAGVPSAAQAETLVNDATGSTVRVEATACGDFVTGSGFAVNAHHIVTNAHVVAGSDKVWISFNGQLDRHAAEVVLYDPELDIALLYEPDVRLTPLTLSGSVAQRGQQAAALGYTGGGGLRTIPAVVSRDLDAVGRDIYGNNIVERSVIELRQSVAPGDSGGPLLIAGGDVMGVTFSKSDSDPQIGYALGAAAVEHSIAAGLNSSDPADTQSCIQH
ncbi:MAG: MarP family serine protease [Chloroflexota bacterium]